MKRNSLSGIALGDALQPIVLANRAIRLAAAEDDARIPDHALLLRLSGDEVVRANTLSDAVERRHFLFRRSLQRQFVAQTIGWQGALGDIELKHGQDQRPICVSAPGLCLSFSSSGNSFLFAAAEDAHLGVDIERLRPVENVVALAQRFFSPEEAQAVADCPDVDRSAVFLTMWSAKEAGLKAKGRGIVSGLNSFSFQNRSGVWHVSDHDAPETSDQWQLFLPDWRTSHVVAVMHRPAI